jgi:hypothetical protein
MKYRLFPCKLPTIYIVAKVIHTFCPIRNLVVHAALGRAGGLDTDVPLPPRQEVRDGDKNVTGSAPEILDDVVFSPLIGYSNLVDRVDVLD